MIEMKCPFCNKPLQPTLRQSDEYWCENYDCPRTNIEWVGSQKLWQAMIDTKNQLTVERTTHDILQEELKKLQTELERTHKALDVAVDALKMIKYRNETYNRDDSPDCIDATLAIEQITALDRKD